MKEITKEWLIRELEGENLSYDEKILLRSDEVEKISKMTHLEGKSAEFILYYMKSLAYTVDKYSSKYSLNTRTLLENTGNLEKTLLQEYRKTEYVYSNILLDLFINH